MSACDTCPKPGNCCRLFTLSGTFWDDTDIAEQWKLYEGKYPFVPVRRKAGYAFVIDQESGRMYSSWQFSCPKLGPDGRCTIYETRPDTCRVFEPGSDPICVLYAPRVPNDVAAST